MEKKETIKSVTFILSGSLLQIFNGVGDNWRATLASIFGIILLFIGLRNLKNGLDNPGKKAVMLLIVATVLGIIGLIFDLIPLLGIVAGIFFILTFILELVGFIMLLSSATIGAGGKTGAILLIIAMIVAVIESILGLLPFVGGIIGGILGIIALILVFFGWLKIQDGLLSNEA
jgi:hypothetical protein